jgi:transcriptional regulator NrdR family protein
MGMKCPTCGTVTSKRYRSPAETVFGTFRRHHCRECGTIFLSVQTVVTGAVAEDFLDRMAKAPSSKMRGEEAGSAMTELE